MEAMPDPGFQFAGVRAAGEMQWHVHRGGRFLGSIAEVGHRYRATQCSADAALRGPRRRSAVAGKTGRWRLAGVGSFDPHGRPETDRGSERLAGPHRRGYAATLFIAVLKLTGW
jgi:hypothetical protein